MKNESTGGIAEKVVVYLISIVLGFIAMSVFMLIFAAVSVALDVSDKLATPFASVSAAAGALASAFLASKKLRSMGLINGLVCGGIMFFVVAAVALIISDGGLTLNTLFNFIIIMLSALIGGVWGVNQGPKKII